MKIQIMKYRLLGMATLLLAYACNEDLSYREPAGTSKGAPQQVSEVEVKNYPGKATISYSLPADPDLLYVKATYTLASGKVMDVKSSYFVDSLVVEGFADTQEHEIKLYTVNRHRRRIHWRQPPGRMLFRYSQDFPKASSIHISPAKSSFHPAHHSGSDW